jgi:type VI secretion system secreted protein VgrG
MPSPKNGNAGSAVPPAAASAAQEADTANPGAVEQIKAQQQQTHTGKYGSVKVKPYKAETDDDKDKKKSWIEIVLVDEVNEPVPGEAYRITLPDETVAEGTLDEKGFARVEGFDPGTCKITFPKLDKEAWQPA